MQYRTIPNKNISSLPEHINLLRNFQDIHSILGRLPYDFPVLELSSIIPNYEERYNNLVLRGNKLISKYKINDILHKLNVDMSIGSFVIDKLLTRKNKLIDTLEFAIDKWQNVCDQIDKIEEMNENE